MDTCSGSVTARRAPDACRSHHHTMLHAAPRHDLRTPCWCGRSRGPSSLRAEETSGKKGGNGLGPPWLPRLRRASERQASYESKLKIGRAHV